MHRFLTLPVLLIAAACSAGAQGGETAQATGESARATGTATQRNYEVGAFDAVTLAGSHNVVVTVGGAPSVRAEGDSETLDRLEIKVEDGALKIGSRDRNGLRISLGNKSRPVTVYVTAPSLRAANVAGSGDMRIDKVEGEAFAASIAGSGDMRIDAVRVANADFSIAGSGNISAAGGAARSDVSIAGSGDVELSDFETGTANVSVVGSGDVRLRATETADVSIMGSGDVEVAGGARCSVNKRGSGDVRCG